MAKIETAIKEAILRGARRQARAMTKSLRREVRRLRVTMAAVRRELQGLRNLAGQWQRSTPAVRPEVSDAELRRARLSPGLIRKLRARLGLSQAALARAAGVSTGAVVQWERGRSSPSGQNRKRLVALRKLGRRDVKRLLASLAEQAPSSRASRRRSARRPRRRPVRRRTARARRSR